MELFAIGLGLIIGSFLNVLILRTGTGMTLGGRSACPHCARTIPWYDLIPVASWFILAGRCRRCHASISVQYPLVEGITAVLFVILASSSLLPSQLFLGFAIIALFIAIAGFDLRHSLIPDLWSYLAAACAAVYGYLAYGWADPVSLILGAVAAPLPLLLLWAYSRGRWMGFGDVKLAVSFGLLLGPLYGFVAVMFAFVIGAVVSLGILLPLGFLMTCAQRYGLVSLSRESARFTMQSEVPFGPFLIASCIILWFTLLYGIELPLLP